MSSLQTTSDLVQGKISNRERERGESNASLDVLRRSLGPNSHSNPLQDVAAIFQEVAADTRREDLENQQAELSQREQALAQVTLTQTRTRTRTLIST